MDKINVVGQMDNTVDHTLESANRVYGSDGIAPTVPTCGGVTYSRRFLKSR